MAGRGSLAKMARSKRWTSLFNQTFPS